MSLDGLVTRIEPAHTNERRVIWEMNVPGTQRIQSFQFFPSETSGGNHYHEELTECFLVTEGCMSKLVLVDIRTGERKVWTNLGSGSRIFVPPFIAHANCFKPGTRMVCACSTAFDPKNPDVYPYPLLDAMGNDVVQG